MICWEVEEDKGRWEGRETEMAKLLTYLKR